MTTRARIAALLVAVARAVEETAVVRALAALLGQACSDEAMQDSGPWEFTLPLESVGFGASSVHLRLSFPSLQVRFDCRMPGVAALLLRHQDSLRASLQRDVPGLTDVDIAIFDA